MMLAMGLVGSTRIEVTGHRSDPGRWRAAYLFAALPLHDSVLGYFARESFLPRPLHERHLPLREVTIVLNFASPHRIYTVTLTGTDSVSGPVTASTTFTLTVN
jgi:hypothetical protein